LTCAALGLLAGRVAGLSRLAGPVTAKRSFALAVTIANFAGAAGRAPPPRRVTRFARLAGAVATDRGRHGKTDTALTVVSRKTAQTRLAAFFSRVGLSVAAKGGADAEAIDFAAGFTRGTDQARLAAFFSGIGDPIPAETASVVIDVVARDPLRLRKRKHRLFYGHLFGVNSLLFFQLPIILSFLGQKKGGKNN
jgi:hypothetical protein